MARNLNLIEVLLQQNPGSPLYSEEKANVLKDIAWWEGQRATQLEEQARIQNESSILAGQGGLASVSTGLSGAAPVDTAGTATLPPSVTQPAVAPAAEPSTAIVPRTQTEALTGIGTAGTTGIGSLTTVGAGTQVGTAQPVDLTADSQTTSEILEFTPTEDFIEGTAVEIAGQIPGTVATQTTPTTTTTATQTTPTTGVFTFAEDFEPPPEEPLVEEEPGAGAEEPDTEVTIQEAVDEAAEEEEAPFECPDGYTAVKLGGRWVCQKTETSTVGRPTIGTRPYLSEVGFAGPSPYRPSTRTVTRTVTAAE